jgi:hypothetical protein
LREKIMADLEQVAADVATLANRYNLLQDAFNQHLRDHALMDEATQRAVAQQIDTLRRELKPGPTQGAG